MEGHSQLANCVRGKTMALFKPWRCLVPKPPNVDVAKEARILCDGAQLQNQNKVIGTNLLKLAEELQIFYFSQREHSIRLV